MSDAKANLRYVRRATIYSAKYCIAACNSKLHRQRMQSKAALSQAKPSKAKPHYAKLSKAKPG